MHPSASTLMRRTEEDIEIGDYRIPEGWTLFVCADVAQRLPGLFTEPQQYDPLRFAPDRAEDRQHRFSIIGFGGGVHKCAGMNFANNEMMIITSLLFQQFDLELVTKNPGVTRGMGASRPEKTLISYRRKPQDVRVEGQPQNGAETCPHLHMLQAECPAIEVEDVPDGPLQNEINASN